MYTVSAKPICLPNVCTLYGSALRPLLSPGNRYNTNAPTMAATPAPLMKCDDLTTDSLCTLQCKPGFTPLNAKAYYCFNRAYNDGVNGPDDSGPGPVSHGFVTQEYYDALSSQFPTLVEVGDPITGSLVHLKCPAQMCQLSSLPTPSTLVGGNPIGSGLSLADCYGRVAEETCRVGCLPGYLPKAGLTPDDDKLTCQAATGPLTFTGPGSTFGCTAQTCQANYPILTIAETCGTRWARTSPCSCAESGGNVPGCLGVDSSMCLAVPTDLTCVPACKTGFSRAETKTLVCTGQSFGFMPETVPGTLLWREKKPIYKPDLGLNGKLCKVAPTAYQDSDHMGFKYGANGAQVAPSPLVGTLGGWQIHTWRTDYNYWRIAKTPPTLPENWDGNGQNSPKRFPRDFQKCLCHHSH